MPIILIYCVALALATTVTMWFAPVALWRGNDPAGDLPAEGTSRIRETQTLEGLLIRREGFE